MKEEFEDELNDLSWSKIVDIIQGDEKKASELINSCASELESVRNKIRSIKVELDCLLHREKTIINGGNLIAKHINKKLPLVVQKNGYIIIISDTNILIEKNVI